MKWSDIVPLAAAQFPDRPGLYKLLLRDRGALADTILAQEPEVALLYIGKAEKDGLRNRHEKQHLAEESGWSTFRRSLGAVLREKLSLTPVPRRCSPHRSNYSFDLDGEQQLTKWMLQDLAVSWAAPNPMVNLEAEEKRLIGQLRPALNILHNRTGKYARELKRLRQLCRDAMRRKLCGRDGCCQG